MEAHAKGHPEYEGTNPVIGQGVFYVPSQGLHLHELSPSQSSWKRLLKDIQNMKEQIQSQGMASSKYLTRAYIYISSVPVRAHGNPC
jgi:hypothetical protein